MDNWDRRCKYWKPVNGFLKHFSEGKCTAYHNLVESCDGLTASEDCPFTFEIPNQPKKKSKRKYVL